jgi:hypothetical protein
MSFDEYDGPPGRSQHVFHDDIAPTGNTMLRSSLNARQLGLIEANLHDFDWMSD